MVVQHHKLPLLLALALICLMPSWVPAQGIYDYYGSYYYPSTPDMQEGMFYADAYNFLHGGDECYYPPYGTHVYNTPAYNAAASYNIPSNNTPAYNASTNNQNTVSQNATNWLNEANVFYLTGSYQQAAESYAKAVNIDPSLSEGWLNLENSLYFLGRYQAALNAYDALLNLEPKNANALAGRSQAILALNKTGGTNTSTVMQPSARFQNSESEIDRNTPKRIRHFEE